MNAVRRAQPWLGTLVSIELAAIEGVAMGPAFAAAFAAIERVHRAMSTHDAASDVARFNMAGAGAIVECDPWTLDVLRRAERLRRASGGLFDVALGTARGPAYRCAGPDERTARAARARDGGMCLAPGACGRVRIEKLAAGACLDLGGIAKGYAVDRAVIALRASGIVSGRVNAGGDLRVFGPAPWPVVVRGHGANAALRIDVAGGAVATSVYRAGRTPFHHDALFAPAHGCVPAIDAAVTVAAPNCVLADALTKVVALTGDARHPLVTLWGARGWLH